MLKDKDKRKSDSEYYKSRYYRLVASGTCVKCGKNPAIEGLRLCSCCYIRDKEWRSQYRIKKKSSEASKAYYQLLKKNGICTQCGQRPALPDKVRCEECHKKDIEYNRNRRYKTDEDKKKQNKRVSNRYYRLKEQGLCVRCGQRPSLPGLTSCLQCRLSHNQSQSGYFEHSEKYLKRERLLGRLP